MIFGERAIKKTSAAIYLEILMNDSIMNNDMLQDFLEEAKEMIEVLNHGILTLEQSGGGNIDIVNEIFRSAHTLKGMSGMMGFTNMNHLTHTMENALDKVRNGEMILNTDQIDVLFECLDELNDMLADIINESGDSNVDTQETLEKLKDMLNSPKPETKSKFETPVPSKPKTIQKAEFPVSTSKEEKINQTDAEYLNQLMIPDEVLNLFKKYDVEKLHNLILNDYNIYYFKVLLDKDFCKKNISLIEFYKKLESSVEIILSSCITDSIPDIDAIDLKNYDMQIVFVIASKQTKKEFFKKTGIDSNKIFEIFETFENEQLQIQDNSKDEEEIFFELTFDGEFITPEIIKSFKEESVEHIHEFNECLLKIEKNPDNFNPELINAMFRAMHTMKGLANMFSLKPISEFAHKLENSIDAVRNGKIKMTESLVELLLKNCDSLGAAVQELVETNKITKINNKVLHELLNLINSNEKPESALSTEKPHKIIKNPFYYGFSEEDIKKFETAITNKNNIYEITFFYKQDLSENINNFDIIKTKIELFGEIAALMFDIDEIIGLDYFNPANFDLPIKLYYISQENISTISMLTDKSAENIRKLDETDVKNFRESYSKYVSDKNSTSLSSKIKRPKPVRKQELENHIKKEGNKSETNTKETTISIKESHSKIKREQNEELRRRENSGEQTPIMEQTKSSSPEQNKQQLNSLVKSGVSAVEKSNPDRAAKRESEKKTGINDSKEIQTKPATSSGLAQGNTTVRVDIEKLDALMNLVGELLIAKTQVEQIGLNFDENISENKSKLKFVTEQLGRVTNDIQEAIMKTRMVPIGTVFNRFPRVVRDIAKARNKKVNLIIKGEETELDKTVIEEIGDPMVHLIRNALDHGIEEPEKRIAAGKSETGTLTLNAFHEGNHIIIEIADDGAGINPKIIRKKSLEKGLLTIEESNMIPDAEIIKFIFKPGFSTAEVITDISGRGVGMDVVKSNISKINGIVDIQTNVGAGTTFTIKLPLTLAIINSLLVKVGEQIFATPLAAVIESLKIKAADIGSIEGKYEIIKLRDGVIPILRLNSQFKIQSKENKDKLFIVVIGLAEEKYAIVVDDLLGQQEIVIKSLNHKIVSTPGIAGATILGDGQVVLILDISTLISNAKKNR
ncbi:MAG TPA: Hpt domain-containing protein [bacterium]|nr:Hpt domain-containing protein [bacterium]